MINFVGAGALLLLSISTARHAVDLDHTNKYFVAEGTAWLAFPRPMNKLVSSAINRKQTVKTNGFVLIVMFNVCASISWCRTAAILNKRTKITHQKSNQIAGEYCKNQHGN